MNSERKNVLPPAIKSNFYPTFFLCLFLGGVGAHRFYTGKMKSGIAQLVTLGGCGIWVFVDLITILLGKFKDKNGVPMSNGNPKLTWPMFVIALAFCGGLLSLSALSVAAQNGLFGKEIANSIAKANAETAAAVAETKAAEAKAAEAKEANKPVNDVTRLGTYQGTAPPRRVMGVSMTGEWTVSIFKHKNGEVKCKCTLRSYDAQSGWNTPTSETVKMEITPGEEAGKCQLKATGKNLFQDVVFNEVSLESGSMKEAFLFDNDTVEVVLERKSE